MKVIHRIVGFFFFVVMLSAGVMMLWASLDQQRWLDFARVFTESRISALPAALLFLLLSVLYVISAIFPGRRSKFLSFDKDGGTVSISTEAIAEYIAKLGTEFPSVVRMKPTVIPKKNAVDIVIDIKVKAGPQIHEVCELLQQRIRESVTTGLGITQVRNVEVSVGEIVSEHRPG